MKTTIATVAAASILLAGAFAQSNEAGKRRVEQQQHVAQGVKSGELTAGETAKLKGKEARINREIRRHRALNDGHLTKQEKKTIGRQQNGLSRQINSEKHDTATAHYGKNAVDARRENQQDRIVAGIVKGQIGAGEAAHLEKGEAGINREVRADRKANGGSLTTAEKAQVNRQQNGMSRKIARARK